MEFWEITKERTLITLTTWQHHLPALKIGTQDSEALAALFMGFEPLASACVRAQYAFDGAYREVQSALATMRVLGTKVPQLIEGQLDENRLMMIAVKALYKTSPRTEDSILKRLRELLPVWRRANTALAALTPPQPAITRKVGGVVYTEASARVLYDSYIVLIGSLSEAAALLAAAKEDLAAHDFATDELNKRWYKVAKALADTEDALAESLARIPTEPGTPAPTIIEISTIEQGGAGGMEAMVEYEKGGGDHATTRNLRWKVEGVDADFVNAVELNRAGNKIGPFLVGQVVSILGEVINSSGRRTSAIRTITMGPPIV